MTRTPFCVLFALVTLCSVVSTHKVENYAHSQQLSPKYKVSWTVDNRRQELKLGLEVQTSGWIGFGIGEETSGSMPGADILTGWYNDTTGACSIQDRYALAYAMPVEDGCQNWVLVACNQTNGKTFLHVTRKLRTNDTQDRDIVEGEMRVLWAIGSTDTFGYHMQSSETRGVGVITFIEPRGNGHAPNNNNHLLVADFKLNTTIPPTFTSYMCQSFTLPVVEDAHIVVIEPIISTGESSKIVHHMLIHICDPSTTATKNQWDTYNTDTSARCISPLGNLQSGCRSMLYGWAVGSNKVELPVEAGVRMGTNASHAVRHIMIEMHYNNADGETGVHDDSGIRIYYTKNLRKYDAAVMTLGDPIATFPDIPPLQSRYEYEADCPAVCTQHWPHEINIFSDFLHMHMAGTQMWSNIWRGNTSLGHLNRADFYGFHFQQNTPVQKTIKPGDRISTHCVYNTANRQNFTEFSIESTDEMCMEFIFYYPMLFDNNKLPYSFCGYANVGIGPATWCGGYTPGDILFTQPNPSVHDPPGTANITFGKFGECMQSALAVTDTYTYTYTNTHTNTDMEADTVMSAACQVLLSPETSTTLLLTVIVAAAAWLLK